MTLHAELRSSKKGLIDIKNEDQKCFLWCHVRHINPLKLHPERITKKYKKLVNDLDYDGIEFPVQEKDFSKIKTRKKICINVFGYENRLTFPIYVSGQKFQNSKDLLLLIDDDKSRYVYIKDLADLCFTKQKIKTKNTFVKVVYSALVAEMCC